MTNYCIIMTSCASAQIKDKITNALLKNKLAACIQSQIINSSYLWQGKITKNQEELLMIKTKINLYEKIAKLIRDNHDYQIPEIIAIPIIAGDSKYFSWIEEILKTDKIKN